MQLQEEDRSITSAPNKPVSNGGADQQVPRGSCLQQHDDGGNSSSGEAQTSAVWLSLFSMRPMSSAAAAYSSL